MRSADPATRAPSGQPRPFERQRVTVSNSRPYSAAGVPLATVAFMSRAPSRCTERSCRRASATTSRTSSIGHTLPPPPLCVFSRQRMRVGALWMSLGKLTAARTWAAPNSPRSPSICFIARPECTAGPPSSERKTCASASATTSSPGSERPRRAIWFAIVAVGRKMAASWPRSSAARSSSAITVGSSRFCSSPTSASAMARRMPGVGCVAVSERRSITARIVPATRAGRGQRASPARPRRRSAGSGRESARSARGRCGRAPRTRSGSSGCPWRRARG